MNKRLVPCPSCHRHLFVDEKVCPHCHKSDATLGTVALAALAVVLDACGGVYGPPPADFSTRVPDTAAPSATAPVPPPNDVAVYGPPPVNPNVRAPDDQPKK